MIRLLVSRLCYYLSSVVTLLGGVRNWLMMIWVFLGIVPRTPFVLHLRRHALQFRVRSAMDIWIIKETCLDQAYEHASVPLRDGWTILDIGAGLGDFSLYAARRAPNGHIYSFEPSPDSFALLQENIRLNKVTNIYAHAAAVGAKPHDMLVLDMTSSEAVQYRTHSRNSMQTTSQPTCPITMLIPSKSLDQIFDEIPLDSCDFLKIDCEGAEYDILFHTSAATLARIQHICLEYHDGVTSYSHRDLITFFQDHGFIVRCHPNPVHQQLGLLFASRMSNASSLHAEGAKV